MRYKNSFVQHLQVFPSVPGFIVRMQDLARYGYMSDRTFVEYAWALSHAYVENISASYVTAIHSETRDVILDYLAQLEPQKQERFESNEWTQLCNVFDKAAEEVWHLLKQSWRRYVESPYFSEFKMSAGAGNALTSEMTEALRRRKEGLKKQFQTMPIAHNRTPAQHEKLINLLVSAIDENRDP